MNTQTIQKIPIEIKYKKQNGMIVFDLNALKIPETITIIENSLILIPPKQIGGNHKHPRTELLIGLSEYLEIHWLDEKNNKHTEKMIDQENLYMYFVPPYVPHAVFNTSDTERVALYEVSNEAQHDVERVTVIETTE